MRDATDPAVMRETIKKQGARIKQLEAVLSGVPDLVASLEKAERAVSQAATKMRLLLG